MNDDTVLAGDRWIFDGDVADVFDDMLERSIPGYVEMRRVTTAIALRFLSAPAGRIVDLGAARGEAVAQLLYERPRAEAVAVELSAPMADAARARLRPFEHATVLELDLRSGYPDTRNVDVVLCVLTLQFVPVEHRYRVLADAYESLRDGGALVLVEKILGSSPLLDGLLAGVYRDRKLRNGYTDEQIDRKRLSLEGVLVPATGPANESFLRAAGFAEVERIWQSLNFAGWLAVKR